MKIPGLHHVTAIAGEPQRNVDFYAGLLGLKLVKLTVNFDDPGTYHLYYGDQAGTPGTILTFFPWAGALRGRQGVGQTSAAAYAVGREHLEFWKQRIPGAEQEEDRFGQPVIGFADPEGLKLELVGVEHHHDRHLTGFHSVTLSESGHDATARLLVESMGYHSGGQEGNRLRYETEGERGLIVDILCQPDARPAGMGAGSVHHVAFRAKDEEEQRAWRTLLAQSGQNVTPVLDRSYFRSIYFREPGGVLFEIATDPPGFAIDEPAGQLGRTLRLPKWLEPRREQIERVLPKLRVPESFL